MRPVPQAKFAFVDASFLGMPLDAIVGGYVYAAPGRFLLISAMAGAGSALGSIVIYWLGYKGGEVLLIKRRCFHGWLVLSCCACLRFGRAP